MRSLELVLAVLACAAGAAHGGDILAVFPHTGKSHFFMFEPLIRKLAERGHKITLISHYRITKPSENVKFISLEGTADGLLFNSLRLDNDSFLTASVKFNALGALNRWGQQACDAGLGHPPIRRLIESKQKFHLVMVEYFNTDCFSILSHVFEAPLAAIFSSVMMPWHYDRFGNPDNPSYIVNQFLGYPAEMNLQQRVANTMITFAMKLYYHYFFVKPTDSVIRRHLGEGLPSVAEVVKNSSLFLINSHFSLFQARPLVPGIVEVGGMHVKPGEKLAKNLQDFLDGSKNGAIVFSLGSTILGYTMPEDKRRAIAESFRKISLNVIWKWENDTMPDKPSNVLLQKWIPQNDVLAHPNVKLFVTHSGLMGTEEAVYHGVPMVMIPLFGDQPINAISCQEKGLGILIDYNTLSEETFFTAVKTVLEDKRFAERAEYVSRTFRDRPISSMDSAVYWTEYVIRYEGAPHLRSAAIRLPWYSEYLLDVLVVVCSIVSLLFYVAILVAKLCWRRKKESKEKSKKL